MVARHAPLLATLLVLGLAVAGCIGSEGQPVGEPAPLEGVPEGWWVNAVPSSITHPGHDHSDRAHHQNLTTANFEILGWDPLVTDEFGTTATGMGCGGAVTRDDGLRLAIVHSLPTTMGFVVADITDPAAPKKLGEFYLPNADVWDADISADGNHVLIGAYPPIFMGNGITTPPAPANAPAWAKGHDAMILYRDACTGNVIETGPINYLPGPAIIMVGIHDPANPAFEDYVPQPVIGPHSVGSQMIDGKVYVTSSVTNLVHEGSYYTFFELLETPAGGKLLPLSVIQTPGVATPSLNGHTDVYLHLHPLTDQLLAYLANWNGLYIYDLSVPQAPLPVSAWFDRGAGSVHTTYPFPTLVGDKQYLAVGQEVGEPVDLPSGWVYLLDITDPASPTEVSRWTLPVKPKWDDGSLQFSPHYVAVLNQTLFVSNYHGGLWAVDVSNMSDPRAVGIFVPLYDSPAAFNGGDYGPVVEDVIVDFETNILTTWDGAGGIYQLRFDDQMPAARAPAWPVETDQRAS